MKRSHRQRGSPGRETAAGCFGVKSRSKMVTVWHLWCESKAEGCICPFYSHFSRLASCLQHVLSRDRSVSWPSKIGPLKSLLTIWSLTVARSIIFMDEKRAPTWEGTVENLLSDTVNHQQLQEFFINYANVLKPSILHIWNSLVLKWEMIQISDLVAKRIIINDF